MKFPESALDILDMLADPNTLTLAEPPAVQDDPLHWISPAPYLDALVKNRRKTGLSCGIAWGKARMHSQPVILAASDWRFIGASIGTAEAAALSQCFAAAVRDRLPVIWIARGGGLRLQQGAYGLAAVARVLGARNVLAESGVPLISVAADPVFAGCTICAMQGDVVLALEGSRIGFAGAKVIEMFEKGPPPEGFQTAAYALATGQVDAVVPADDLRSTLVALLQTLALPQPARAPVSPAGANHADSTQPDAWQLVLRARSDDRASSHEVIGATFDSFFELRGDRTTSDDPAIVAGLARIAGRPVILIAHAAARTPEDKIRHNFAMAHPAGHRKALRLVRLAERLRLPIVTLVDTPGTCPDVRSESEGQAGIMGQLLCEMLAATVPTVSVILGQGNSGGAMVLATADHVLMTSSSYYTVISPEGAAAVLWENPEKAADAAAALHLAPTDLLHSGLIDSVVPFDASAQGLGANLRSAIAARLSDTSPGSRIRLRD
jgi:acetyl-CoA carboxylase carboxyl transferase subunit beta